MRIKIQNNTIFNGIYKHNTMAKPGNSQETDMEDAETESWANVSKVIEVFLIVFQVHLKTL